MLNDIYALRRIKEGDISTFEAVFKLYYSKLTIYAFSITDRQDVAEEVVQDVFYKIWKERQNLQIVYSLKSYLYAAVRNQALQYCEYRSVRERHRENLLTAAEKNAEVNPEDQLLYKELEDIINKTLEKIPPRRKQIFKLHRFEGKKYKEIAEELSLSVKTIEAEMTKAYQTLRTVVENYTNRR